MEYGIEEERVGAPTYKVDEAMDEMINTLAEFLNIERSKVAFFTEKMGLAWLDEPGIVGVTQEQQSLINDLRSFLRRMGNE